MSNITNVLVVVDGSDLPVLSTIEVESVTSTIPEAAPMDTTQIAATAVTNGLVAADGHMESGEYVLPYSFGNSEYATITIIFMRNYCLLKSGLVSSYLYLIGGPLLY